jgi:hypothetical protein
MTAAEYGGEIRDVPVTVKAASEKAFVGAEVSIDVSRVDLQHVDDRQVGALEIAVFCADSRERVLGQVPHRVDLKLTEDTFPRLLTEGLRHAADIPIRGSAGYVKAVVYDHRADRLGSAIVRLR